MRNCQLYNRPASCRLCEELAVIPAATHQCKFVLENGSPDGFLSLAKHISFNAKNYRGIQGGSFGFAVGNGLCCGKRQTGQHCLIIAQNTSLKIVC